MNSSSTSKAATTPQQSEHLGMATENDFMNVAEAAALLGVHIQTLRKLARQKQIPAFKLGRDWRFRREALVQWADAQHLEDGDPTNGCSVLIIDDEEKVCAALTRMVERFGCRARHATDGQTGLELVAHETPDVILLDLRMPGMTGPMFLEQLRKTHPHLPVVVVTGYPDSEIMRQAMQYAPLMVLAKPVEKELLERTVRMVIDPKKMMASG